MLNNLKPKIIAFLILALLIFQPISLVFASTTTYTYDQNGNILTETTEQGTKYYTWDYKDQLIKSVVNGITTTYAYDHTGQRIQSTSGGITTVYPSKYYSIDSTGKKTKYIYIPSTGSTSSLQAGSGQADDQLVAIIETVGTTVTPYYVHTDHLGSINVVTDKTGAIVENTDYYPYGSVRLDQKTGSTDSTGSPQAASFSAQRKYIGQEYDELTKLNYLNARYYDSKRGQFISQDPVFWEIGQTEDGKKALLNPQSQNSYSYANNNPITFSDPDGKFVPVVVGALFMYAPQIMSFAQSLMTPLGQVAVNQAINDAQRGNYGMAVIGTVTAGEIPSWRAANNIARFGDEVGLKVNNVLKSAGQTGLDLTDHAAWRMTIRNVTPEQVIKTIENNKPIDYFHDGAWKNGFRDAASKIFVGQEKNSGRITTVIDNTSRNYLSNLIQKGEKAFSKIKK